MKKTKLYIAAALLIQAAAFIMLFIILCVKKKSIGEALLAVAFAGGAAGIALILSDSSDELARRGAALKKSVDYEDVDEPEDTIYDEEIEDVQC